MGINIDMEYDNEYNDDSLVNYKNSIGRFPILSEEEERELALRVKEGSKAAKTLLINCNLRLVIDVAKHFCQSYVPKKMYNSGLMNALISYGNEGLIKAADNFDPTKGYRFSTFAWSYIDGYIKANYKKHNSMITVPKNTFKKFSTAQSINATHLALTGENLSDEELAKAINVSEKTYHEYVKMADVMIVSIEDLKGDSKDGEYDISDEYLQSLSFEDELDNVMLREYFQRVIDESGMSEIEKKAFILYNGILGESKHTFEELGKMFNCSRQWVCKLYERAVNKFKEASNVSLLDGYVSRGK